MRIRCDSPLAGPVEVQQIPKFQPLKRATGEVDGIEATRQIREIEQCSRLGRTFIAAYTANIAPADKQRCFDAGMDYYLNKPLRPSHLAQALKLADSGSILV